MDAAGSPVRRPGADSAAMALALELAVAAGRRGEVPVGALVLGPDGAMLAACGNEVEARRDASAHAELLAMRAASPAFGSTRLVGCTLVTTLEPCPMCAAALVHFRVDRVVFGAYDAKGGGVEHGPRLFAQPGCLHRPEIIGGLRETDAAELLRDFFHERRGFHESRGFHELGGTLTLPT